MTMSTITSAETFHFYRRVAALVSLLFGAVYMVWKIKDSHVLADEIRFSQEQVMLLSNSNNETVMDSSSSQNRQLKIGRSIPSNIISYERQRTKINTFYAPIQTKADSMREQKVFEADQQLLKEWKDAWYDAGWEPVILTLENAKQHPMFELYWNRLVQENNMDMMGKGGRNEEYNRYCFLRFLAMASVGGGLLADYDMMPLVHHHHHPSNNNMDPLPTEFTVYQKTLNKAGGIPSLAAGSASEWQRMADAIWTLAETQPSPGGGDGWSDMLAIMQLGKNNPNTYRLESQVLGYKEVMDVITQQGRDLCVITAHHWAIHFSHYDVQSQGYSVLDRPNVVHEFMMKYKEVQCPKTKRRSL